MTLVPGGGLSIETRGLTQADAVSGAGNHAVYLDQFVYSSWPVMTFQVVNPPSATAAFRVGNNAAPGSNGLPLFYQGEWIILVWDIAHLRTTYGVPTSQATSVTVTVQKAQAFFNNYHTANDLLACVPPAVQTPTDLAWYSNNGNPIPAGDPYFTTSGNTYASSTVPLGGGVMGYPARPFPSTIGAGGWTQLSSYSTTTDTWADPGGAQGTWTIPVNLTTHVRNDKLVIVCATAAQFTQNSAALTAVQDPNFPDHKLTLERWYVDNVAYLNYAGVPLAIADQGNAGRVHFAETL